MVPFKFQSAIFVIFFLLRGRFVFVALNWSFVRSTYRSALTCLRKIL
ncbi:hypothetical protein MtrunA17_Chr1g0151771 [Medicago truncatula]|uniref:Transmembrane protein n=1 Tax=Medicago truncatula TaxID=3880 RepID=A0A396JG06_MEDTR|nr:hypothetical protein MtrunA17_Chr1g0151771 [Medicago truncatula]